jgi:hypothetical protein
MDDTTRGGATPQFLCGRISIAVTLVTQTGINLGGACGLTKFVTQYEPPFQKGDTVEVTGVKVKFEGIDTIFARTIKRGSDEFLFRDNDGKPLW